MHPDDNPKSARSRYFNDPLFHLLVDQIYVAYEKGQYTPSDIRDAAMFACIKWESEHIRNLPVFDGALQAYWDYKEVHGL